MRLSKIFDKSLPDRRRAEPRRSIRRRRRAIIESLEGRRLLATLVVTNTSDRAPQTCQLGNCTLREAVIAANNSPGPDVIQFSPQTRGTIVLDANLGELTVTESVTIEGPGASELTVRANTATRELRVLGATESAGDVTIEGLTLTGGKVLSEAGGAVRFLSAGTLTVVDSTITGNSAANGGGIYAFDVGNVVVSGSTVSGNSAAYGAGGGIQTVDGDITVTSSKIDGNAALNEGGGLVSQFGGAITVHDSEVTNNRVTYAGYNGAGIASGEANLTITGSTITGNTAAGDGGGIYNYSGTVSISASTISGNQAAYTGGGVLNEVGDVSITGSLILDNRALYGDGGGIATGEGNVLVTRSTLSGNRTSDDGGAIATGTGAVAVVDSTLSGNSADELGGGIATLRGPVGLLNSTVSGNAADGDGGGLHSTSAPISAINTTITQNRTDRSGGGIGMIATGDGERLSLINTVVAQNIATTDPDFTAPASPLANLQVFHSFVGNNEGTSLQPSPVSGTPQPTAQGNFIGGSGASAIDPRLGPLQFNGGRTETHLPLGDSLLIDAGDSASAVNPGPDGLPGGGDDSPLEHDQRSYPYERFFDGGIGSNVVDIGAVEVQSAPTFVVDSIEDVVNGDFSAGDRTLREVLELTNASLGLDHIRIDSSVTGTMLLDPNLGALQILDSVSISGPGADQLEIAPVSPNPSRFRVFDIADTATDVTIAGLTMMRGNPTDAGGAIRFRSAGTLVVQDSTIRLNSASLGGGIFSDSGAVHVVGSTLENNRANSHGGAIATIDGSIETLNSTISDNESNGFGGGIYTVDGSVTVSHSTVTLNEAGLDGGGIGLVADGNGESLTIRNSIIAVNSALNSADFNSPNAPVTNLSVSASLIGDNSGTSLTESALVDSVPQPDADLNLIGGGSNPLLDPLLGSLADNGGPTRTHALLDGSLAIDGGDSSLRPVDTFDVDGDGDTNELLPADQRGAARVVGAQSDIGAFEIPPDAVATWDTPADIVYETPLGPDQLDATSPTPGTFVYTPAAGTVLDAGAGQVLTAVFTPDDLLVARPVTVTTQINVLKADPTITWANPADIGFGTPLSATQLNATTSVAGSFAYDPILGTVLDAGQGQTLRATFTPDDSNNYNVVEATTMINVNPVDPVITWNDPADITFGTALSETQLNATSPVAGNFVYDPILGTVLSGGTNQTLRAKFTPDNATNFNVVEATVSINVIRVDPVITWADPADIVFGTALSGTQLNATADVPGTLTYDPDIGEVLSAGNDQQLMVTFVPDEPNNYNGVTATVEIDVLKADPVITWADPAAIDFGTPLDSTQLNAQANVAGAFVYDPDTGTILGAGAAQTLSTTFTPTDMANYNVVGANVQIDVNATHDYGDAPILYPVVLADDGARHVPGDLRLGAEVDIDPDGLPSDLADGDGADDDGVTVIANTVSDATVDTTSSFVVVASESGRLDAWFDFNRDGDWGDAGEQIADNLLLTSGPNTLSYTVPSGATPGDTAVRFRVSSTGDLEPTGAADDGEVEDYLVAILDGATAPAVTVTLPSDSATVRVDQGDLRVSQGASNLFQAPVAAMSALEVFGGGSDDTITLDLDGGVPTSGLLLNGLAGANTLGVEGAGVTLDLTAAGVIDAANFGEIDLSDADSQQVHVDAAAVVALAPADATVRITGAENDAITFADDSDWLMTAPVVDGGRFYRVATNQVTGEVVELDLPSPWQNPIEPSDVSADGTVTAGDALRVINELGRRTYSDTETKDLRDPLEVQTWPGNYYDQNADGKATALDALRVINQLARISLAGAGEGESVQIDVARTASGLTDVWLDRAASIDQVLQSGVPALSEPDSGKVDGADLDEGTLLSANPSSRGEVPAETAVDELLADVSFLEQSLL